MNNQLTIVGYVGANPQLKAFDTGNKVAKFSIAVKDFSKKEADTPPMWIDVEAWNTYAEKVVASVTQGREVLASGRLAISEYTKVAKDGQTVLVQKPVLKLTSFYLAGPKPKSTKAEQ